MPNGGLVFGTTALSRDIMGLQESITELYKVFQPYRLGPGFAGCDHCVNPKESAHLARTPLRDLSLEDLGRYAFKAMTTWGGVNHFKYFLPRLFELAAEVPEGFELEVLFGKLAYASWQEWPAVERDCVERYLHAFWRFALQDPPSAECDDRIDTVLCAIGNACPSVQPFLDEWLRSTSAAATRQLAQLISINHQPIATKGRLASAYWHGHAPVQIEIIAWLRTREVYEHVARREATLAPWQQTTVGLLDAIRGTGFH